MDNPATAPGAGGEFVEDLAWRMDTDGQRTGTAHKGTNVQTMHQALLKYLNDHGLGAFYTVTLQKQPTFDWVAKEVLRSEDVILLLGFWEIQATGDWVHVGGHFVTAAGVSQVGKLIAFSDPYRDNAEVGGPGRVLPAPHMLPHPATMHNDAAYVSHDIWPAVQTNSPGGGWGPSGYGSTDMAASFDEQNVPDEFASQSGLSGRAASGRGRVRHRRIARRSNAHADPHSDQAANVHAHGHFDGYADDHAIAALDRGAQAR